MPRHAPKSLCPLTQQPKLLEGLKQESEEESCLTHGAAPAPASPNQSRLPWVMVFLIISTIGAMRLVPQGQRLLLPPAPQAAGHVSSSLSRLKLRAHHANATHVVTPHRHTSNTSHPLMTHVVTHLHINASQPPPSIRSKASPSGAAPATSRASKLEALVQ